MCFNLPYKIIKIDKEGVTVEDIKGVRQVAKTMIKIKAGDYCLLQGDSIFEKLDKDYALDFIKTIKKGGSDE